MNDIKQKIEKIWWNSKLSNKITLKDFMECGLRICQFKDEELKERETHIFLKGQRIKIDEIDKILKKYRQKTIQECNKRFRKECYECDFKDIDQKIFAELEKELKTCTSVGKNQYAYRIEDLQKLKQKSDVSK